jgi:hypothetical protein
VEKGVFVKQCNVIEIKDTKEKQKELIVEIVTQTIKII